MTEGPVQPRGAVTADDSLGRLLLRVFLPFALGYFLSYLFRTVNAVIASDLVAELELNAADLGLLTSAYFFAFAAAQLPLGVLLDRYGPRRTDAGLLLCAAAGALCFAIGSSTAELMLGRALIGMGVGGALMSAFKAYSLWFPAARLPLVNGFQMAAGGLGSLAATVPVEWGIRITGWRGVFVLLCAVTVVVSVVIYFTVPRRASDQTDESLRAQIAGIHLVFTSAVFWRVAPWVVSSQAAHLALQTLWVGPWLRDVAGLDRETVAFQLALVALSMITGFIVLGWLAERLARRGIGNLTVAAGGMAAFLIVQAIIPFASPQHALLWWMLFGFLGTAGIIAYAALPQQFPPALTGRVITGMNVLLFSQAFAMQWGFGAIVNLWPQTGSHYAPAGYHAAVLTVLAVQALTALPWLIGARGRRHHRAR